MGGIVTDEVRMCGAVRGFERDIAIGRLRFWRGADMDSERKILCFESTESLREALMTSGACLSGTVSAAICRESTPERLAAALFKLGIPLFLIPNPAFSLRTLEGKLALLDFWRGELIVNPQLDTLCRYTSSDKGVNLEVAQGVKKGYVCKDISHIFDCVGDASVLCACGNIEKGEELFEEISTLAEALCPSSLTVALECPVDECEECFCDRVEALFRAAIYGNISLMLTSACSEDEASRAHRLLHTCFCRLVEEAREFNGYISKGILIDTPLMLLRARALPRCDFFCFDFSLLSSRLTGAWNLRDRLRSKEALAAFWGTWREDNDSLCRLRELRAVCNACDADEYFWKWVEFMGIGEVYFKNGEYDCFCATDAKNS